MTEIPEPLHACCTCKYVNVDMQKEYHLKRCGTFRTDGCNMWQAK